MAGALLPINRIKKMEPLRIELNAGMGHKAEWLLQDEDIDIAVQPGALFPNVQSSELIDFVALNSA